MRTTNQIYAIRDTHGQNGVDFIINIIRYMLDPQLQEELCIDIRCICINTLKYFDSVLQPHHLDCIIKSTLTRMNYINNTLSQENLIIIFAYIFNTKLETVLNTLSVIPGPNGNSALSYVLNTWIQQFSNYKCYEHKLR